MDNNNIFEFILDYFKKKKTKAIFKKYNNFLNDYNVYNLYKIAVRYHYDFLIYYLDSNMGNHSGLFYNNDAEIFRNLINLEIKLKKILQIPRPCK